MVVVDEVDDEACCFAKIILRHSQELRGRWADVGENR